MQRNLHFFRATRLIVALAAALPALGLAADPPNPAPMPNPSPAAKPDVVLKPSSIDPVEARKELDQLRAQMRDLSAQLGDVGPRSYAWRYLGDPNRGMIGVVFDRTQKNGVKGLHVSAVTPGGPADKSGVKNNDIIVSIDGKPVKLDGNLQDQLRDVKIGQTIQLGIARDGKTVDIAVKAERREPYNFAFAVGDDVKSVIDLSNPDKKTHAYAYVSRDSDDDSDSDVNEEYNEKMRAQIEQAEEMARDAAERATERANAEAERAVHANESAARAVERAQRELERANISIPWWGLNLASINPDLGNYFGADHGVLVLSAENDGLKALKSGDVLLDIDGHRIERPEDAMRRFRESRPGSDLKVQVLRQHKTQTLSMKSPDFKSIFVPAPPAPPMTPLAPIAPIAPLPGLMPPRAPQPPPAPPLPPAAPRARDAGQS